VITRRRRAVVAGGLAAGLALVAWFDRDGDGERAELARARTAATADAALRRHAAAESSELADRYDATADAHPSLAALLKPLRAEVAEHITAFGGVSGTRGASPAPGRTPVPTAADAALAALADAEQRLVDSRTTALLNAAPELARLLASVAAAGAGHVFLLRGIQ
jgi:hypothetical protein